MAPEGPFGDDDPGEDDPGIDPPKTPDDLDVAAMNRVVPLHPEVSEYYRRQARLLAIQTEHLHEQRELVLTHLRMRRFSERFKSASQTVFTIASFAVIAFFGLLVYRAFSAKAIVVDQFDTPASLATGGITGKVLAGDVLDAFTRMQGTNLTSIATRTLASSWADDIKVDIPTTGISITDLERLLKSTFGHDQHVGGALVKTESGGLALSIRGDGIIPQTFEGGAGDLQKLVNQAAEYVYGQLQPALYASYLDTRERYVEEAAFCKSALPRAPDAEKPILFNDWGNAVSNSGGSQRAALRLYQAALKLRPGYWTAHNNIQNTLWSLGDEEGAYRDGLAMMREAGGRPGRANEFSYANWDEITWNLQAWRAATIADADEHSEVGTEPVAAGPVISDIDWRLHDDADAEFRLDTMPADAGDPNIAGMTHFVRGNIAAARGDTKTAWTEMEAFLIAFQNPVFSGNYPGYNCWAAPAEESAGHPDRADKILAEAGHFVDCARFRADILDRRGEWKAAQRAYADAVAVAPDLPAAYYSWGVALARHKDLADAARQLAAAVSRGPHWADPLKAWGDVLAQQGKIQNAIQTYDAALVYAPAWVELKHARDAAVATLR